MSETVWNAGYLTNAWADNGNGNWGSGGGISATYSLPSWQTNVSMAANNGSVVMRNVPDVAMPADNIFVVSSGGVESVGGGTSASAPLWAGFTALVNQQIVANGKNPIGFLNPTLYSIANTAAYANCFHDVTVGSNTWSGSPSLFYAVSGYDLCTGLGSPNGVNLISTLVSYSTSVVHYSAPPQPYGDTMSALVNGNPNGTWELFVMDDFPSGSGTNFSGWILSLTTANPVGYASDLGLAMTASASSISDRQQRRDFPYGDQLGAVAGHQHPVSDTLPAEATLVSSNSRPGLRQPQRFAADLEDCFVRHQRRLADDLDLASALASACNDQHRRFGYGSTDPNPADDSAAWPSWSAPPSRRKSAANFGVGNGGALRYFPAPTVRRCPPSSQASTNL